MKAALTAPAARLRFNCPEKDIDVLAGSVQVIGRGVPPRERRGGVCGWPGALTERGFCFGRHVNRIPTAGGPRSNADRLTRHPDLTGEAIAELSERKVNSKGRGRSAASRSRGQSGGPAHHPVRSGISMRPAASLTAALVWLRHDPAAGRRRWPDDPHR